MIKKKILYFLLKDSYVYQKYLSRNEVKLVSETLTKFNDLLNKAQPGKGTSRQFGEANLAKTQRFKSGNQNFVNYDHN